ncbi:retrovirus-related pol polyprotein from transposon tnt 1-94 [Lasius niger]|uniref:Retrovirus-related pol polyprotein from transposon tnt 1-94 n=1 Tax=Lasius niger TaxID=67767 RepID=A0A0J7K9J3_LASNI|nr:retrovirus-related pol polyprotein from transposon tnt 1-94 [Lasius niger]
MFADVDWGNSSLDRRSYTGYTFIMSGGADATKEVIYMGGLLGEFGMDLNGIILKNDNIGAQKLATNPIYYARSKHIDIKHHFVREAVKETLVLIQHVPSDEMTADILTKGLPRGRHENFVRLLGLKPIQ